MQLAGVGEASAKGEERVELRLKQELDAARLDYDRHLAACRECQPSKRCEVGAALRDRYYEAWDAHLRWLQGGEAPPEEDDLPPWETDDDDEWEDIPF